MWETLWPEGPPDDAEEWLIEERQRALDGLPPNPPRLAKLRGKHRDGFWIDEEMASHRPYRPALGVDRGLEEIGQHRGTRYDADVADACIALFQKKDYRFPDSLV